MTLPRLRAPRALAPLLVAAALLQALPAVHDSAVAQAPQAPPPQMKQVAPDLHFWFDHRGTNSIVWATDDGVMVIDTQPHPVLARRLIAEIRKITDKPIRWAFNTQVHGDHYMGNSEFKKEGALIVANAHAAFLMEKYFKTDLARRAPGYEKAGMDPKEVRLVLPDVTFEDEMTIRLGGRHVRLFYPGPAQDPGCAYAHFPHTKALATSGSMTPMSLSNLGYTPSVPDWIAVLRKLQGMDIDVYLPGHGDLGTKAHFDQTIGFLTTVDNEVKAAIAKGVTLADAKRTLTFAAYKDWRNYPRIADYVEALYALHQTGRPILWDQGWERR